MEPWSLLGVMDNLQVFSLPAQQVLNLLVHQSAAGNATNERRTIGRLLPHPLHRKKIVEKVEYAPF